MPAFLESRHAAQASLRNAVSQEIIADNESTLGPEGGSCLGEKLSRIAAMDE